MPTKISDAVAQRFWHMHHVPYLHASLHAALLQPGSSSIQKPQQLHGIKVGRVAEGVWLPQLAHLSTVQHVVKVPNNLY